MKIMTEEEMIREFRKIHPRADISRDGERICPACRKRAMGKQIAMLTGNAYVRYMGRKLHAYYRTDDPLYEGYKGYCGNARRKAGKFPSVIIEAILKPEEKQETTKKEVRKRRIKW